MLVLLTSNAFIPANLRAPPSAYLQAIHELLRGDAAGPNATRVAQHLAQWNSLSEVYRVPILAATLWAALRSRSHPWLRGLALIALSLQAVLFFYFASGRYAYLAWLLTFLVFLIVLWRASATDIGGRFTGAARHPTELQRACAANGERRPCR